MKTLSGIVMLVFALNCNWAAAQGDSAFVTSTIHVAKPAIKAHVEVSEEYAVYLKQGDAPKLGRISGSKLKYIKSKDLRSFAQNEAYPEPLIDAAHLKSNKKKQLFDPSWPRDTVANDYELFDSLADLSKYLEMRTLFTFPSKESHRIDTVQLKIILDKKGKYRYNFASRQDSLNEAGAKCMEALTSIRKWQPAHVGRSPKDGSKRKPKILKAYSEILVTVVLSPFNFNEPEESTEK